METNKPHPIQLAAYSLLSIATGLWLMHIGSFIFVPLIWGVFFAFALYPVTKWLENNRFPRSLAIALSIALISIIGATIIYILVNQMILLIADIPEIGSRLTSKLRLYLAEISSVFGFSPAEGLERWNSFNWIPLDSLDKTLFSTGKSLTLIGIIPLYIFLFLYYRDFFVAFLLKASSKSNEAILAWVGDSGKVIHAYLVGMLKVTFLVAVLAGIYFYAIGIKYYLLFALFIAIMNLIPYIGVIVSSVLVILYVFLTTDAFLLPITTLLVLWGIQLLENNLITP